jgi:hypothetical protein
MTRTYLIIAIALITIAAAGFGVGIVLANRNQTNLPASSSSSSTEATYTITTTYNPAMCWNKVQSSDDGLFWPNGCKGAKPTAGQVCTQALVALTTEESEMYLAWAAAEKPAIPGCN